MELDSMPSEFWGMRMYILTLYLRSEEWKARLMHLADDLQCGKSNDGSEAGMPGNHCVPASDIKTHIKTSNTLNKYGYRGRIVKPLLIKSIDSRPLIISLFCAV